MGAYFVKISPNMRLVLAIVFLISTGAWFLLEKDRQPVLVETDKSQERLEPKPVFSGQDQGEGSITMTVEYLKEPDNQKMTLRVVLDTHSLDLGSVDFSKDVFVEKDGQTYYPISNSDEGSGHHRSSILLFQPVKPPFEVVGQNIGGVARREVGLKE